jgi:excinuclease ABC subunit C
MTTIIPATKAKISLANIPLQPGVYFMLGENREILYIGKARVLRKRLASYFNATALSRKTQYLLAKVVDVEVTITNTEHEALLLECALIKQHQPQYNILLRDDKTYPYILLTNDTPYPRIMRYRGRSKASKGNYFGPYASIALVRETINMVHQLFKLRSCDNAVFAQRQRPCLQYQINFCSAPCTKLISPAAYKQNVDQARAFLQGNNKVIIAQLQAKMATAVAALKFEAAAKIRDQLSYLAAIKQQKLLSDQAENVDVLGVAVQSGLACVQFMIVREGLLWGKYSYFAACSAEENSGEVLAAVIGQHYLGRADLIPQRLVVATQVPGQQLLMHALSQSYQEQGGRGLVKILANPRGQSAKWLSMATKNAEVALQSHLLSKAQLQTRFTAVQNALSLAVTPHRIACFDVSHSSGEATVASCVVFDRNGPVRQDYRRFNITGVAKADDIAAMRQALQRYFAQYPLTPAAQLDLVLLDGGSNQLSMAQQVLAELKLTEIFLLAIAKGPGRKAGLETLHYGAKHTLKLAADSPALHLMQQIRDEAHRFAILGHRKQRAKKRHNSRLLAIPGIGATKLQALLRHFGDVNAVLTASVDELRAVPGINQQLAAAIMAFAAQQNNQG